MKIQQAKNKTTDTIKVINNQDKHDSSYDMDHEPLELVMLPRDFLIPPPPLTQYRHTHDPFHLPSLSPFQPPAITPAPVLHTRTVNRESSRERHKTGIKGKEPSRTSSNHLSSYIKPYT